MALTAQKMCDAVAKNLKEHKWSFKRRDFKDGDFGIDTDVASHSGVFRFYEIRMLFREWNMQTIYYLPIKAPEPAPPEPEHPATEPEPSGKKDSKASTHSVSMRSKPSLH